MIAQFFTIGFLTLFSAMLPGPDFALVTKNSLAYSRRAGLFTSFGIVSAIGVHMLYCVLGLAIVIANSLFLFSAIKYIGSAYLVYLGVQSLLSKKAAALPVDLRNNSAASAGISAMAAFRQGFLCNLLNPKATLFFLAIFTVVVKPDVSGWWAVLFAIEIMSVACLWFCSLTYVLSHPRVVGLLANAEYIIEKVLGIMLVGFGLALFFFKA